MAQTFRLDGGGQTLAFFSADASPPSLVYWGPALAAEEPLGTLATLASRPVPHGLLDAGEVLDLAPDAARGFSGVPLAVIRRGEQQMLIQWRIITIVGGRHEVTITLGDERAAVTLDQTIRIDPQSGVASFSNALSNDGDTPLTLEWLAAAALPLAHDELLTFSGGWANEWRDSRWRFGAGQWMSESRCGRTSHHAPPFLVAGALGFAEDSGECVGLHLGWSGNHRTLVERLRDGRIQAQMGELLLPGEGLLHPGETYETPRLYAAKSERGLNGLRARFHPFVRQTILPSRSGARPRPVHFNTWEALYFEHTREALDALISEAAALGVERFVLDDGWFEGRDSDRQGLGDWRPHPDKYPEGLGEIAARVRQAGMSFGLWVEPEMANADSELLRQHPDWVLGDRDRVQPLGRGQYVLDLTRAEVFDNILAQLDAVLASTAIDYLKWDMNRDLTHAVSSGRAAVRRQTLAAYRLMDAIRIRHPHLEIEACASGGARTDFEVLRRSERIWISDCNDPIERHRIQRQSVIFLPPETLGAHVSPRKSHTTGRETPMALRAWTALFGHMGVEADIRALKPAERETLKTVIAIYQAERGLLHKGALKWLDHLDPGLSAIMVSDGQNALVGAFQLQTAQTATLAPLRLTGLEPLSLYRVTLLHGLRHPERSMKAWAPASIAPFVASSEALMGIGLPLQVLRVGDLNIWRLERIAG